MADPSNFTPPAFYGPAGSQTELVAALQWPGAEVSAPEPVDPQRTFEAGRTAGLREAADHLESTAHEREWTTAGPNAYPALAAARTLREASRGLRWLADMRAQRHGLAAAPPAGHPHPPPRDLVWATVAAAEYDWKHRPMTEGIHPGDGRKYAIADAVIDLFAKTWPMQAQP